MLHRHLSPWLDEWAFLNPEIIFEDSVNALPGPGAKVVPRNVRVRVGAGPTARMLAHASIALDDLITQTQCGLERLTGGEHE